MDWLVNLWQGGEHASVASTVLILSAVAASGLALGSLKLGGIGLGIAGVLFTGLAFGHFGLSFNHDVLEFVREFGLILFVFGIGLQLGPGFFSSLRENGLRLNACAAAVVLGGAAITAVGTVSGLPIPLAVGVFSGATTNTPSLAAAQEALKDAQPSDALLLATLDRVNPSAAAALRQATTGPAEQLAVARQAGLQELRKAPGLGYAVAYPMGILGTILSMLVVKALFRVNVAKEAAELEAGQRSPPVRRRNLEVCNPNLHGQPLGQLDMLNELGVVVSRLWRAGTQQVPTAQTVLQLGDVLLLVGREAGLEQARLLIGKDSAVDLMAEPSDLAVRTLVVTRREVLGKSAEQIKPLDLLQVRVTRVVRSGVELPADRRTRLQYGDRVLAVGEEDALAKAAQLLGDGVARLKHAEFIPVFLGIGLGVILGSLPLAVPGLPAPIKLGLAGGPLIAAIVLARIGRIGPLVWYVPQSANVALRELGIVLFLACVGLKCGDRFLATLLSGDGLWWMGLGTLVTLLPLLVVGLVARGVLRMNYVSCCGLFAGSMTDPPALAFAGQATNSEGVHAAYAAVYPLTMLLRVLSAQVLALTLMG